MKSWYIIIFFRWFCSWRNDANLEY